MSACPDGLACTRVLVTKGLCPQEACMVAEKEGGHREKPEGPQEPREGRNQNQSSLWVGVGTGHWGREKVTPIETTGTRNRYKQPENTWVQR